MNIFREKNNMAAAMKENELAWEKTATRVNAYVSVFCIYLKFNYL